MGIIKATFRGCKKLSVWWYSVTCFLLPSCFSIHLHPLLPSFPSLLTQALSSLSLCSPLSPGPAWGVVSPVFSLPHGNDPRSSAVPPRLGILLFLQAWAFCNCFDYVCSFQRGQVGDSQKRLVFQRPGGLEILRLWKSLDSCKLGCPPPPYPLTSSLGFPHPPSGSGPGLSI